METSELINEIAKAMAQAQAEIEPAAKGVTNTFYKSKYADISAIWDVIRAPLTKNGICVLQDVYTTETGVAVKTRLVHSSGQWFQFGPFEISVPTKSSQECGKAATYAKRYSLAAAVGATSGEQDDDGESSRLVHDRAAINSKIANSDRVTPVTSEKIAKEKGHVLYAIFKQLTPDNQKTVNAKLAAANFENLYSVTTESFEAVKSHIEKTLKTQSKTEEGAI